MELLNTKEPIIIAETAFSHEGSYLYLIEMINGLKDSKNICIKFQVLIDKNEYLTPFNSVYNEIDKWILSEEEWETVIDYAFQLNVPIIIAVLDKKALNIAKKMSDKILAIEIHPSCVPDSGFMKDVVHFCETKKKHLIIGISGFAFDELEFINNKYLSNMNKDNVTFMYGFQNYPTELSSLNLNRINLIKNTFKIKVGYADHTDYNDEMKDYIISSIYGKGINLIEVHYVIEYGKERIDYIAAYDSKRILKLQQRLLLVNKAFGKEIENMNDAEKKYSKKFRKVPVFDRNINKGTKINQEDIVFKRATKESEFLISEIESIIGKSLNQNVERNQEITLEDFE